MFKNFIFVLIAILFLTGCATMGIYPSKEATYTTKLDKVLITSNLKAARYSDRYIPVINLLSDSFTKRHIAVNTLDYRWADKPDTESLQAAVATFRPNHVMEIALTKYSYSSNIFTGESYDFEVNIVDISLKKTVWKSSVFVSNKFLFGMFGASADEFSNKVIANLEKDGLLVPEVVK